MKFILLFSIVFVYYVPLINSQCPKVKNKFMESEIVPELVDSPPKKLLKIHFPNELRALLGNNLTPDQAKVVINIDFYPEDNVLYTLIMVSSDLPTKEKPPLIHHLHWMVINIPETKLAAGEEKAKFTSPDPTLGAQRFVFFMFEQKDKISVTESYASAAERDNFSVKSFATKYKLVGPHFGNFFIMNS